MDVAQSKRLTQVRRFMQHFEPEYCLYPDKAACKGRIVDSHSVQKERYLRNVAEDGWVMVIEPSGPGKAEFMRKGIKKASVFSGFCQFHDAAVFSPIENKAIVKPNAKQHFWLAYRACSREFSKKIGGLDALEAVRASDRFGPLRSTAERIVMQGRRDAHNRQRLFDKAIKDRNFGLLRNFYRTVKQPFSITASVSFCWDRALDGQLFYDTTTMRGVVPFVMLSVLPHAEEVAIAASIFREDRQVYINPLKEVFERMNDDDFLSVVSYWLVDYCENWFSKPSLVSSWVPGRKAKIEERFAATMGPSNRNFQVFRRNIGNLEWPSPLGRPL